MIRIIKKDNFVPDLKLDVHYVCWTPFNLLDPASYNLFCPSAFLLRRYVKRFDPQDLYEMADDHNEPVVIAASVKITIMPARYQPYTEKNLRRHFRYLLDAQNNILRVDLIVFDLREYTFRDPETGKANQTALLGRIEEQIVLKNDVPDCKVYVIWPAAGADGLPAFCTEASDDEVVAIQRKRR